MDIKDYPNIIPSLIDSLSKSIQLLDFQGKDTKHLEDKLKEITDSIIV